MSSRSHLSPLKAGKLPGEMLDALLSDAVSKQDDPRLLVGPGVGEDAAHIDFGERVVLAKSDPITFATESIGWYAVNVNANDIAVAGGEPKWFLATVLLPIGTTSEDVRRILTQISDASRQIGVSLAGGHTEITHAVTQPTVCGFMIGEAASGRTVTASGAEPGDVVILTKGIAIEATAILANEFRARLIEEGVGADDVERGASFLTDPGISVLDDARVAVSTEGVSAMHDPTEGGLATALHELSFASRVNLEIDRSSVRVIRESEAICAALGIDPWGAISSGALLATVSPSAARSTLDALRDAGISACAIGRVTRRWGEGESPDNVVIDGSGRRRPLPRFARDELARFYEENG